MKKITVEDCKKLRKEFYEFIKRPDIPQKDFIKVYTVHKKLDRTNFEKLVSDQEDARAMFRVVLGTMGKDFNEYKEEEKQVKQLPNHISIKLTDLFLHNEEPGAEIEEMINEQLQDYLRDTYGNDFESVAWDINLDVDIDWYDEDDPTYLM